MKRTYVTLSLILLLLGVLPASQAALFTRFSDYMYIYHTQESTFNEVIWFWTPDTIYGAIHCNTQIGIRYSPQFYGLIFSSANEFNLGGGASPWYPTEPQFRFPQVLFPDTLHSLRELATTQGNFFDNPDNSLQFRCTTSEDGWQWWAWPADQPWDSTQVTSEGTVAFGESVLFFDGHLDIFGDGIQGSTTIGASGNMRLVDNLLLTPFTVDDFTDLIPEDNPHMLGLASEANILIGNTCPNGRGNGLYHNAGNHDNAHIIIMASLLALNEEISFEDQNDPDDDYYWCDPAGVHSGETDERGDIYLRGSAAFYRMGYLHRSTCGGTGYTREYVYDTRLAHAWPTGSPEIEWQHRDDLVQKGVWHDTTVTISNGDSLMIFGDLELGPGTTLIIEDGASDPPLELFSAAVKINGTAENPVHINIQTTGDSIIPFDGDFENLHGADEWRNLQVSGDNVALKIPGKITGINVLAEQLTLIQPVSLLNDTSASIDIDSSVFRVNQLYTHTDSPEEDRYRNLEYSEVTGWLYSYFNSIDHCTFAFDGFERLQNFQSGDGLVINNTCFTGTTTLLSSMYPVEMDHCAYLTDAVPAMQGDITYGHYVLEYTDPEFIDPASFNFHLQPGSPLIDAGDPLSPADPDGSRTDIGAYCFDYTSVDHPDPGTSLPDAFHIESVYPNPFNPSTEIRIALPQTGLLTVTVYDVLGREVQQLAHANLAAGMHCFTLDGTALASGTYFVQAKSPQGMDIRKILLLK